MTANTVLNLSKRAIEIFEGSEVMEKRQFLNYLLQNAELKDRQLTFELRSPFNYILEFNSQVREKQGINPAHPIWLRGRDSNPRPIGYTLSIVFTTGWTISSSPRDVGRYL